MIIDSLCNHASYAEMHPRFGKAFEYLRNVDFSKLTEGRNEIDGDEIFLMMTPSGCLKKRENAPLEAHNRYIDIQLVLEGDETYGWCQRSGLDKPRGEFDAGKDIIFFNDAPSTFFTLHAGEMAVFFPHDAHAPMIGEGKVKKCIVKVMI